MEISVCFSGALDPQLFNISFSLFAVIVILKRIYYGKEKPRENVIRLWILFDNDEVVM